MTLLLAIACLLLVVLGRLWVRHRNMSRGFRWQQRRILNSLHLSHSTKPLGTDRE